MLPLIKEYKYNKKSHNKVLIITGTHGDELTPLRTAYLLNDYFTKEKSARFVNVSSITIATGINNTGIRNNSRRVERDNHNGDLNRMFDEEFDYDNYKELKKLIDEHNIIIDIHSSPRINELLLVDIDEHTEFILKWAKKSNLDYACRYPVSDGTIKRYAFRKNKIGLTIELNLLDKIDFQSASAGEMMVINLIDNIDFDMNEEFVIPKSSYYLQEGYEMTDVKAGCEGILLEKFQGGKHIKRGTLLAEVVDYEMVCKRRIFAEHDSFIVSMPLTHYVMPNSTTYTLMRTK